VTAVTQTIRARANAKKKVRRLVANQRSISLVLWEKGKENASGRNFPCGLCLDYRRHQDVFESLDIQARMIRPACAMEIAPVSSETTTATESETSEIPWPRGDEVHLPFGERAKMPLEDNGITHAAAIILFQR